MYLISKRKAKVAHVWTGSDTVCRMFSTGGMNKTKYLQVDASELKICKMCAKQETAPVAPKVVEYKKKPCCKKCGLPIAFKKVGDKWHPTNVDGSDHWDLCNATRREGKTFNPDTDTQSSGFITGANYIETNCDCLPWDKCSNCGI